MDDNPLIINTFGKLYFSYCAILSNIGTMFVLIDASHVTTYAL